MSVSHSVSVVSVKVSSSSIHDEAEAETAEKEVAAAAALEPQSTTLKPILTSVSSTELASVETTMPTEVTKNLEAEATTARPPSSTEVAENREPKLVDVKPQLITSTTESLITTPSEDVEATTTTASKRLARVKYEHISDETTLRPPFVTSEDIGIPRLIDSLHGGRGLEAASDIKKAGITSETARALGELGFEYKEYIDDSGLFGEESNDEVIPAFDEEAYDQAQPRIQENDLRKDDVNYSSARAVPSTSEQVFEDEAEAEYATSRQQSKKAPLPHQYEPSTIIGITIGAFLLIFIGTGRHSDQFIT